MDKDKNRYIYLDIIKIVACFLVIVNHTNSRIFLSIGPSATWFASLTYFFICKIAVPLFIMASGAVLLGREEPYVKCFLRVFRIIAVLIAFSLFYYLISLDTRPPLSFTEHIKFFFSLVYRDGMTDAFWYLYVYIGLLVMLPILQIMLRHFRRADYAYVLFWSVLFFGCIPLVFRFFPVFIYNSNFLIPIFNVYTGLFIMGHFLHKVNIETKNKTLLAWAGLILPILLSVILTYAEYKKSPANYLYLDERTLITVTLPAVSAFYLIKLYIGRLNMSPKVSKRMMAIGQSTFGIYLFSDYFIGLLNGIYSHGIQLVHPLVAIICLELAVFCSGLIITFLLRKISFIAKFI